jgi:hypothetical protein
MVLHRWKGTSGALTAWAADHTRPLFGVAGFVLTLPKPINRKYQTPSGKLSNQGRCYTLGDSVSRLAVVLTDFARSRAKVTPPTLQSSRQFSFIAV